MKRSEIKFEVELDDKRVPEKIFWQASESGITELTETKSVSISLWDHAAKNTMRIDLWAKDMEVRDMKRFYIDCLGGLAQSMLNATGDELMSQQTNELVEKLALHVEKEIKAGKI
ncbi:gliding motility protein GldC [Roseivirga sp. BDSF3-8]|uniref:gliding motility protein GldC n=1 Tax=Roseivirga sp. BDSF3-8 TaxID=3241598 RepID=UPI0035323DF0